ncbi:uroporphyrinogen-III synthase [Phenylobacterium sp.]|jgi:uroporphyrinogen-III synthase|uniref:uroporphyrinogen-III synthase n=1 Tax=Phenylobacterium sp. TaxID=1871053 RepID=UPI002E341223|nr:uroporphyrinogen-III synthase [Phenylobacterium sp.]HEX2561510.1 uroporphyrinogen-III synthase [Phenylobacterium sp.]
MRRRRGRQVWITRARPGADATAGRVRALGHEPFVLPLLEVRRLAGVTPDVDDITALAFTSANAVRAFAQGCGRRDLKVYAVGGATALAAQEAGFGTVLSADGDVQALAQAIIGRHTFGDGPILHPSATEPAGDLVGALTAHGLQARRIDVYESVPVKLGKRELNRLKRMDDVLIHSAKGGRALADLLRESPLPQLRALGMSQAALAPLAALSLSAKLYPARPAEADLLRLIDTP